MSYTDFNKAEYRMNLLVKEYSVFFPHHPSFANLFGAVPQSELQSNHSLGLRLEVCKLSLPLLSL